MARNYGKIESKFWAWATRNKLSAEARIMALYLLSGPHASSIGVYYLPDGYVSADLGMGSETVSHTLSELSRKGFAYRCSSTDFIFIPGFLEHNPPENINVGKMMQKTIDAIPDEFSYWFEFKELLKPYGKRFGNGFINGLPNRMATPEPEPEPEPDVKKPEDKSSVKKKSTEPETQPDPTGLPGENPDHAGQPPPENPENRPKPQRIRPKPGRDCRKPSPSATPKSARNPPATAERGPKPASGRGTP